LSYEKVGSWAGPTFFVPSRRITTTAPRLGALQRHAREVCPAERLGASGIAAGFIKELVLECLARVFGSGGSVRRVRPGCVSGKLAAKGTLAIGKRHLFSMQGVAIREDRR
jgi:hypothetical protein